MATLAGCLSFDALTGGVGSDAGETNDATTSDASVPTDAAVADASVTAISDAFDCDAFPDAALCDDFNRTSVIPFSDPRWARIDCQDGGTVSLVTGQLNATAPASNNFTCGLASKAVPNSGKFQLDFDLTYDVGDASAGEVILAELSFTLSSPNADGVRSATYQLLVSTNGNAEMQLLDWYPDAAASPVGESYVAYDLANASPFIEPRTKCHITIVANDSYLNPTATATSHCEGANPVPMSAQTMPGSRGLSGVGELVLGYVNNQQSNAPAWSTFYDDVVYTAE